MPSWSVKIFNFIYFRPDFIFTFVYCEPQNMRPHYVLQNLEMHFIFAKLENYTLFLSFEVKICYISQFCALLCTELHGAAPSHYSQLAAERKIWHEITYCIPACGFNVPHVDPRHLTCPWPYTVLGPPPWHPNHLDDPLPLPPSNDMSFGHVKLTWIKLRKCNLTLQWRNI